MPQLPAKTDRIDGGPEVFHGYAPGPATQDNVFQPRLSIAVSREAGARGRTISRRVAELLGWQFIDQETLECITENACGYSPLDATHNPAACDWIESRLVELKRTYSLSPEVTKLARVVLDVAARGECVILGRGAGWLLPAQDKLFVRLVAPIQDRIAYVSQLERLAYPEARRVVEQRDESRRRLVASVFGHSADDLTQYDMVLNVALLGVETCCAIVSTAAREKDVRRLDHLHE